MIAIIFFCVTAQAHAQQGNNSPVILEIAGKIEATGENTRRYTLDDLKNFQQFDIRSESPWIDGFTLFSGVLVRELLEDAGAMGDVVLATALNDYSVEIPTSDFQMYNVILAYQIDGAVLTIRDRGPLWVIYPYSDVGSLQNELYYSRSIWQLKKLDVK